MELSVSTEDLERWTKEYEEEYADQIAARQALIAERQGAGDMPPLLPVICWHNHMIELGQLIIEKEREREEKKRAGDKPATS